MIVDCRLNGGRVLRWISIDTRQSKIGKLENGHVNLAKTIEWTSGAVP